MLLLLSHFSHVQLCDPTDGSPPGFPIPGILQVTTLEWVAISFSNAWKWKVKVKSLSRVWPSATPWTAAFQAPPSMGFSRQEYWSGVPLPSPVFLHSWDYTAHSTALFFLTLYYLHCLHIIANPLHTVSEGHLLSTFGMPYLSAVHRLICTTLRFWKGFRGERTDVIVPWAPQKFNDLLQDAGTAE